MQWILMILGQSATTRILLGLAEVVLLPAPPTSKMAVMEPQWRQPGGFVGNLNPHAAGGFFSDPWAALDTKATVKDLLKMKRLVQNKMHRKKKFKQPYVRSEGPSTHSPQQMEQYLMSEAQGSSVVSRLNSSLDQRILSFTVLST
ncbi:hypothetical protein WMY93_022514 [Mugilogobius chulae]|uniref:Uncharacterized protein n=1 Tax=Mugilogobius chulae TaxID=88201 RepID=A0AAW0NBP4_9GOBI